MLRYVQLTPANIASAPNTYAIYVLKFQPLGKVWFGSTSLLRDKLYWWRHSLGSPVSAAKLPMKVQFLLNDHGFEPNAWGFCIFDQQKPQPYNPKWRGRDRPEWPLVARLLQTNPDVVLNTVPQEAIAAAHGLQVRSTRGPAPLTYLGQHLGEKPGRPADQLPPHGWKVNPRTLVKTAWGSPFVPFARYLYRSAIAAPNRNPSREAIAELYANWLKHVPASEREALGNEVPYTIDEALAVPTPRGYSET